MIQNNKTSKYEHRAAYGTIAGRVKGWRFPMSSESACLAQLSRCHRTSLWRTWFYVLDIFQIPPSSLWWNKQIAELNSEIYQKKLIDHAGKCHGLQEKETQPLSWRGKIAKIEYFIYILSEDILEIRYSDACCIAYTVRKHVIPIIYDTNIFPFFYEKAVIRDKSLP